MENVFFFFYKKVVKYMVKYYIAIIVVVFAIFLYNSIQFRKRELEKLRKKIKEGFGTPPDREYEAAEFEKIAAYYKKNAENTFSIDDITWNDLDMDSIFMLLNNTFSSSGEY